MTAVRALTMAEVRSAREDLGDVIGAALARIAGEEPDRHWSHTGQAVAAFVLTDFRVERRVPGGQ